MMRHFKSENRASSSTTRIAKRKKYEQDGMGRVAHHHHHHRHRHHHHHRITSKNAPGKNGLHFPPAKKIALSM